MIKAEQADVEVNGKTSDVLAECAFAVAGTANLIADGDEAFASAALYSVFMSAARILHEVHNTDVDTSLIGNQIAKATLK